MPHSPLDTDGLRERVHKVLDSFVAGRLDTLAAVSPDCLALSSAIGDLLRGGKRLRAAFCYWGWRGAGGRDGEEIVTAAAAMELFQAAALIHDDVMDDSDLRRGMPAMHRRFGSLHARSGWDGDSARFGLAGAVLAGDLCLVWSDELFTAGGFDEAAARRGRRAFDRMRTQLMAGQYLDMLEQCRGERPLDPTAGPASGPAADPVSRARQVIRYKSAKYTIEEPLSIGGELAGADAALLAGYQAYGLPLGEAFQLRDDVLGVFGEAEVTGKPAGDDLREGKRTVLVGHTLAVATPAQATLVRDLLGDPMLDTEGVSKLRQVIVETGALAAVESLVSERVAAARAALAGLPALGLAESAYPVLDSLVGAATERIR